MTVTLEKLQAWANSIENKSAVVHVVGQKICVGDQQGIIQLLDLETGKIIYRMDKNESCDPNWKTGQGCRT